jgi:hypothetical protein
MSNDVYQPALAQLAEHRTVDPRVAGSSPAGGTSQNGVKALNTRKIELITCMSYSNGKVYKQVTREHDMLSFWRPALVV